MDKAPKRPRDPSQLAKMMVDIAAGLDEPKQPAKKKDPAAVARGRAGGLKGGKARAESLTSPSLSSQARKAALARWKKS